MKVKLKAELISGTGNPVIFVNDVESVVFDNEKICIVAKGEEHNFGYRQSCYFCQ
nr:MAG TPA: RNA-binding protein [Caudoviricetes sp.]